ncbi:MAG TPA: GNAT family N-acetyltransferase, partial [Anaerolineae bacterium]|nr:GNAT family N-acetyltransferase [Anaerolineae bacterium]
ARDLHVHVQRATPSDLGRILGLLENARRRYVNFGREDLPYLLQASHAACLLADTGPLVWGFACATSRLDPQSETLRIKARWAYLRALALINGWRLENGVPLLLEPLLSTLRGMQVDQVACLAWEPWLERALTTGPVPFRVHDHIISLERDCQRLPPHPTGPTTIRSARLSDVSTLLEIDNVAFDPLWAMTRQDLAGLLISGVRSMIAELGGTPVGYALSSVEGVNGQVIRLAVRPEAQRQGIGHQLLIDALHFCAQAGARWVSLNTQTSNHGSLRLYESVGFYPRGDEITVLVRYL